MQILRAAEYEKKMKEEIVPFLGECRTCGYFNPESQGRIYYEKYCRQDAKGVVVIAHGFTETAEKYQEMIYYFLQAGYQVYIMDMRGHGRSARESEDLSLVHIDHYESYVADLSYLAGKVATIENPDLPLYLYGHSMGGGIGAALLEEQPGLFQRAVLSSPMLKPKMGDVPAALAYTLAVALCGAGCGKKYVMGHHAFLPEETFEDSAASCRERYEYYYQKRRQEPLFQTSGASYGWLREALRMSKNVLKEEQCHKIRTGVLLFQAEKDDYVISEEQERFIRQVNKAQLIRVPGTKHEIYMSKDETMEEYIEMIRAFLGGTEFPVNM